MPTFIGILITGLTVSLIRGSFGDSDSLVAVAPLIAKSEPQPLSTVPTPTKYEVQAGDTLSDLALRFGVPLEALATANALEKPYLLQIGQELTIPASADAYQSTASPPTPSLLPTDAETILGLFILVNKSVALPPTYEPADLVVLESNISVHQGLRLQRQVVPHLQRMITDARKSGFDLRVVSAYRSHAEQAIIYRREVGQSGQAAADRYSARPGHSQHQLGTTIDISSVSIGFALYDRLADTPEGRWLAENAYRFGFIMSYPAGKEEQSGYAYEPWHFRYIGGEHAQRVHEDGWLLDLYLEYLAGKAQ